MGVHVLSVRGSRGHQHEHLSLPLAEQRDPDWLGRREGRRHGPTVTALPTAALALCLPFVDVERPLYLSEGRRIRERGTNLPAGDARRATGPLGIEDAPVSGLRSQHASFEELAGRRQDHEDPVA